MLLYYLSMIESAEDRDKFERLYLKYRSLMMHIAMAHLHNQEQAEDCVHNAFLNIMENLDKFHDVDSPETKALLVIITERRAIDLFRKNHREIPMDQIPGSYQVPPPGDNALADRMAKLPAQYRNALVLRYVYGYSTKELASMYHMTQSGVRKLLARAKEKLKEELEEKWDTE